MRVAREVVLLLLFVQVEVHLVVVVALHALLELLVK